VFALIARHIFQKRTGVEPKFENIFFSIFRACLTNFRLLGSLAHLSEKHGFFRKIPRNEKVMLTVCKFHV
jgi:hypothetical protein